MKKSNMIAFRACDKTVGISKNLYDFRYNYRHDKPSTPFTSEYVGISKCDYMAKSVRLLKNNCSSFTMVQGKETEKFYMISSTFWLPLLNSKNKIQYPVIGVNFTDNAVYKRTYSADSFLPMRFGSGLFLPYECVEQQLIAKLNAEYAYDFSSALKIIYNSKQNNYYKEFGLIHYEWLLRHIYLYKNIDIYRNYVNSGYEDWVDLLRYSIPTINKKCKELIAVHDNRNQEDLPDYLNEYLDKCSNLGEKKNTFLLYNLGFNAQNFKRYKTFFRSFSSSTYNSFVRFFELYKERFKDGNLDDFFSLIFTMPSKDRSALKANINRIYNISEYLKNTYGYIYPHSLSDCIFENIKESKTATATYISDLQRAGFDENLKLVGQYPEIQVPKNEVIHKYGFIAERCLDISELPKWFYDGFDRENVYSPIVSKNEILFMINEFVLIASVSNHYLILRCPEGNILSCNEQSAYKCDLFDKNGLDDGFVDDIKSMLAEYVYPKANEIFSRDLLDNF